MALYRSLSRGLLTLTCCVASVACGADGETDALDEDPAVARQVSTLDGGSSTSDAATAEQPVKPYVNGVGIGVSDLAASNKFYTDVFGLKALYPIETPDFKETVLEDPRGNHVFTMKYTREVNTKNNPVKLVFGVARAAEWYQKVLASGGSETNPPQPPKPLLGTSIGFAQDPDGYLIEVVEVPSFTAPVLVAVGVGVDSLSASADFYTRVLGLKYVRDISVPGFISEKDLASTLGRGPNVQLMDFVDPARVVKNIPAKIVLNVPDAAGFADFIKRTDPSKLLLAPGPFQNTGLTIGMARDLEGYEIEILQPPAATDAGVPGATAGGLDAGK